MKCQIRYVVQKSEDGVLWHDEALCMSEEEAEETLKELENRQPEELTIIMRAGCDVYTELNEIRDKITELKGSINTFEAEGIKTLAYTIQGEYRAEHYFYTLDLPQENVAKLGSWLNLRNNVLRYLLIKADTRWAKKEKGEQK